MKIPIFRIDAQNYFQTTEIFTTKWIEYQKRI